jgi:predicted PurR-regulated permease PerM
VYAVVFAVLVWVVGLVLSQVLRDVRLPSSATLVASLVLGLIAAAIYMWLPVAVPDAESVMANLQESKPPVSAAGATCSGRTCARGARVLQ